jgi:predicted ATPase
MITLVKLKNFKAFEEQSFQFKPLTLLSGLNSTGKSSLLQSLLLLRQSYQQKLLPEVGLALNGDLVSIGTAQDALFADAKENSIGFEVLWEDGTQGKWDFSYSSETDVLGLASQPNTSTIYESSIFSDRFHYLQAERIGPRTYLEISDFQVRQHQQLGTQGEYTAHFLSIYGRKDIPNSNLKHPEEDDLNLKLQVEAWIGEVSPGTRLEINSNPALDLVSVQYSYGLSNPYRATNIGFGISYTLPIIVAILASKPGTLILIEHPEAHLHPKGQVKMGELLSLAASSGVQVVVETHSDHVLNGIRLAVHGGKLAPQDVQCNFLTRTKQGMTEVISPHIDRNGRIDQWPDGFFNEWENSLYALLEPAGE